MSISSNILSGNFTSDYRDKYLQNFRNIEKINYYIHDDYTLLDYAGNWSWKHWDGHQRFIEDVFISIDPLIDLDFSRTSERSKAQIEIYKVSPESPFADDGLLGIAMGSHQVDDFELIGFPKSKSFGFYRMAAWSMASDYSPFLDDQKKYDLVKFDDAYTILHELGHTLGLSHPQSGGDDPSGSWHTSSDTVMSYNSIPNYDNWGIYSLAPRWSSSDISALQTLWGLENDNKTYTITPSASSINEGSALTTSIATKNVASGTSLYYTLSGNGITAADFSSGALSGSGLVGSNGAFSFTHTLANDLTTEGIETLNIKLFSDSSRATQVGSTGSVSIADTSITPVIKNTGAAAFAISGKGDAGSQLSIIKTKDDPEGNGKFTYKWQSSADGKNWTNLSVTSSSYTLAAADASKQIRSTISYLDGKSNSESVDTSTLSISAVSTKKLTAADISTPVNIKLSLPAYVMSGNWNIDKYYYYVERYPMTLRTAFYADYLAGRYTNQALYGQNHYLTGGQAEGRAMVDISGILTDSNDYGAYVENYGITLLDIYRVDSRAVVNC